ncbi:ATP-dependent 6-phosphofructokinase 4, chloroplastic [Dorcoceras hygrometricum]|uniref:ATP-dependent 6-phosphofructokinase 4, chloroplastic n=1 Tax=Dorcoceras hygrometricum TaxID=472368 RepID=A0A2Z7AD27_9LAMI|nr:ATP-dependent 6-phosphofructokinase 4, chloroplastic [Dorcoceras hygrometricum]
MSYIKDLMCERVILPFVFCFEFSKNSVHLNSGSCFIHQDHFTNVRKMEVNMKYIDPTYMIRAIPSNASDNIYCTLLAHSAVHGAMAGYTGFTVGPVNSRHSYIPISRVTETPNTVKLTDRMWARLLTSTNQPNFLRTLEVLPDEVNKQVFDEINNLKITSS